VLLHLNQALLHDREGMDNSVHPDRTSGPSAEHGGHTVVDMSTMNDAESAPLVNGSTSRAAPSGDVHADVRYSMHRDTDDTD